MTPDVVLSYLLGAATVAIGIRTIGRRAFPAWMKGALLWPLIRITPTVAILHGWAAVLVGAAAIAYAFAPFALGLTSVGVYRFALICVTASLLLVLYATWLSRRPEPGSLPPLS